MSLIQWFIDYYTSRFRFYVAWWKWFWNMPIWYNYYRYDKTRRSWHIAMDRWDAAEPKWKDYASKNS